jgi:hypothetical protein
MATANHRYVAKAEAGVGWRIWNRRSRRWWGNFFAAYPQAVLDELNGPARPDELARLCKTSESKERIVKRRET